MDTLILNTRLTELSTFRKQLEAQLCTVNGHIDELNFLIKEDQRLKEVSAEESAA